MRSLASNAAFTSSPLQRPTPASTPIREDAPQSPINPYGATKLICERILSDYADAYGLRAAALRYFNAAGADPDGEIGEAHDPETHLIPLALEAAAAAGSFSINGDDYPTADGTCVRDYIHVSDLAQAHLDALRYLRAGGASLTANCGYGRGYSVREVIDTVKRVSGTDFRVDVSPRRPGDPAAIVAAPDRARATLGWQPRYDDLSLIVDHALAWEKHLIGRNAAG